MYNCSMPSKGRVIGLTGNMACGKTTVARLLAELGLPIVDADQVSREVTEAGSPTLKRLTLAFGPSVLDNAGRLNRPRLRELAFASDVNRNKLEAILHPAIQRRSREHFEEFFARGQPLVVYEASLIVETGRQDEFDGLLVVTCAEPLQKERIRLRDATLTAETAQRMIDAQLKQADKIRVATWVIENNGSLEELRSRVKEWFEQTLKGAKIKS